jgi:ACS family hexuronate transporter-like MFS transporter
MAPERQVTTISPNAVRPPAADVARDLTHRRPPAGFHIRHLRWYIAGLLFIATVINYIDRQVFSILAPDLQEQIGWSELDYGRMVIAFQLSYAVMMMLAGGLLDRIGTKLGLGIAVFMWSVAEIGHAFARTAMGFGFARFFLGMSEAANFPAAVKTVAEWFPARERAFATGIFNSGVALGAVIAPIVVPLLAAWWGWQSAFIATGVLGLLWLPVWWYLYYDLHAHPHVSDRERAYITAGEEERRTSRRFPWRTLWGYRQTWAYCLTKSLADPIWWFYLFWLPKFLAQEHGIRGVDVIPYLTAVYISADLGCLVGGWVSSAFVKRGWTVNWARKGTMGLLALVMSPAVITAGFLHDPTVVIILIALACGAHQAWSTMIFTMASDLFPSEAAASVAGMGGFVAGMISIVTAEITGRVLNQDPSFYLPMFIAAGVLYPIGLLVFHLLSPRMEPARL